jgi:hypothetical protein
MFYVNVKEVPKTMSMKEQRCIWYTDTYLTREYSEQFKHLGHSCFE